MRKANSYKQKKTFSTMENLAELTELQQIKQQVAGFTESQKELLEGFGVCFAASLKDKWNDETQEYVAGNQYYKVDKTGRFESHYVWFTLKIFGIDGSINFVQAKTDANTLFSANIKSGQDLKHKFISLSDVEVVMKGAKFPNVDYDNIPEGQTPPVARRTTLYAEDINIMDKETLEMIKLFS